MRDVSRKTSQLWHYKARSPDWYAVLMASKLVTNADPTRNWGHHANNAPCIEIRPANRPHPLPLPTSSNCTLARALVVPSQTQRAADVPSALSSSRGIIFCRDCRARLDQRGRDLAAKSDSVPSESPCRCQESSQCLTRSRLPHTGIWTQMELTSLVDSRRCVSEVHLGQLHPPQPRTFLRAQIVACLWMTLGTTPTACQPQPSTMDVVAHLSPTNPARGRPKCPVVSRHDLTSRTIRGLLGPHLEEGKITSKNLLIVIRFHNCPLRLHSAGHIPFVC